MLGLREIAVVVLAFVFGFLFGVIFEKLRR